MIICLETKRYETHSLFPRSNWYTQYTEDKRSSWSVIDETKEEGETLTSRIVNSYPFFDLIIENGEVTDIAEWEHVEYAIDKQVITKNEVATITTTPGTTVEIEGQEYILEDGVLEYSNENLGVYRIILKQERHKDVVIRIEVVE